MLKLGVFGDSFAQPSIKYGGWPNDLSQMVNLPLDNFANAGTSLWYSYKLFLENYKNYSHIVFTYTNPHRWASLPDDLVKWAWLVHPESFEFALAVPESVRKQMRTLLGVHKLLFDPDLDIFLYPLLARDGHKYDRDQGPRLPLFKEINGPPPSSGRKRR